MLPEQHKKTPLGTVWVVPAEAKRPCNYPLSTDNRYCEASEEERRYNLLICPGISAEHTA